MYQVINGKPMEVVDFDTMPELPITGLTSGEQAYRNTLSVVAGGLDRAYSTLGNAALSRITYAQALTHAIETGVITEPGKYGIHLIPGTKDYEIYKIIEE
jgi:hypothetical protein